MIVERLADLDLARLFGPQAGRSAEMQALADWMAAQDSGLPDVATLPPRTGRALSDRLSLRFRENLPQASLDYLGIPSLDGDGQVGVKIVTPPGATHGTILFLHGGGWSFANVETHERFMRVLAHASRRVIVAIDYRLAPEHPYPAPLDDCVAGWRWLQSVRASEPRLAGPCAVAGDSAGANLSLALALREQAQGRPAPEAALLFYGCFAADFTSASYARFAEGYGLTRARMQRFWEWYGPGLPADPLFQPLLASDAALAALPPLYLNACSLDPLLSDTLTLVGRLEKLGHPHRFALHEGVHHGFLQWTSRMEAPNRALQLAAQWLGEQG